MTLRARKTKRICKPNSKRKLISHLASVLPLPSVLPLENSIHSRSVSTPPTSRGSQTHLSPQCQHRSSGSRWRAGLSMVGNRRASDCRRPRRGNGLDNHVVRPEIGRVTRECVSRDWIIILFFKLKYLLKSSFQIEIAKSSN